MKQTLPILLLALCCGCCPESKKNDQIALKAAFNDGWMACSIDAQAVRSYHDRLDRIDDSDASKRDETWQQCLEEAARTQQWWDNHTVERKALADFQPFWKRSVGEPRRILKGKP
jgi:hypothetical protein